MEICRSRHGFPQSSYLSQVPYYLPLPEEISGSTICLPHFYLREVCSLFSFDEGAAIHEKITIAARKLELTWLMFKGDHGAWIIIYSVIAIPAVLLAARYFRMAWRHFRRESLIALCGAALFVTGAVGLEIISYLFLRSESTENLYKAEVVCEEFFEMSGISIILYAVVLLATTITSTYPAEVPKEAAESIQV